MDIPRPIPSPLTGVLASVRGRARRHRLPRRVAVVAAAIGLFVVVDGARRDAEEARRAWGDPVTVWVTTEDVPAGRKLSGATTAIAVPTQLVPADAIAAPPGSARTAVDLVAGEIVRAGRLDEAGAGSVGALVSEDARAITLMIEAAVYEVGDRVDLHARRNGAALAADGSVVAIAESTITVAVADHMISSVVAELGQGGVVVILR